VKLKCHFPFFDIANPITFGSTRSMTVNSDFVVSRGKGELHYK